MSIESLRAKALAHAANRRFEYPICIDDDLKREIGEAIKAVSDAVAEDAEREQLRHAGSVGAKPSGGRSLADDTPSKLGAAQAILEALEQRARDEESLIVLKWRVATADQYQAINDEIVADVDQPTPAKIAAGIGQLLTATMFEDAYSPQGEPLGMSWQQIVEVGLVTSADVDMIYSGLITQNRTPSSIPFYPASFGNAATS